MSSPPEVESRRPQGIPGYFAAARSVLVFSAVAVTLLPIPVTYLGILPAYRVHAWFLVCYTPFVCLLTLSYLFYVRDSLARAMFADVLDPPPPPDPYHREPIGERLNRGFRQLKKMVLGILPVVLVITSMYSVSHYLGSLNHSVEIAAQKYAERSASDRDVGAVQGPREKLGPKRSASERLEAEGSPPTRGALTDSLPAPWDSVAVRKYVIRTTVIDDIPQLGELTVLYMGAFVALLIAVSLMALKEYAKEVMGLSEHELMFGRYHETGGNE
jgi:hypothetical protein